MTLIDLQQKLKHRIRTAAGELFGVELQQINAEIPPRPDLGDLAFPISFELAKLIKQATGEKQNPRAIAEKIAIRKTTSIAPATSALPRTAPPAINSTPTAISVQTNRSAAIFTIDTGTIW